jgi:SagB-type dehydrogenase family enzyme
VDELKQSDLPFTKVLEERKSLRAHGDTTLTANQLGEFLYRAARVREIIPTEHGELCNRPYPAGGAMYELEIYAVVNRCEGLRAGLYHYQPDDHRLSKVAERTQQVERLLEAARHTAVQEHQPQVLFIITARFQRVTWKYQSMAYALILKHVGVLYQTMYLVGTAMGLATCALGGGDSDLFAAATGLDYYAESSVGEFILGTRAETRL